MNDFSLLPILMTGLFISILHAMIPTHWLPFVMASRTQKWTWSKTLSIILIAGMGHVIMTTFLGAILFVVGLGVYHQIENYFLSMAAGAVASYGLYLIYQYKRGRKHTHCDHEHLGEHHHHATELKQTSKDGWAILSLLSMLTFSPCESFLPVYLTSARFGWKGFALLSVTLAVGTLFTMISFTWISTKTIERYKMDWFEDHEKLISGVSLIVLAVVLVVIEKSHAI